MTVITVTNASQRLRGVLSRFLLEIQAGLFVGRIDARMREQLWEKVETWATIRTRALMVWREPTAQGYAFKTYGKGRHTPVLVDGIWLVTVANRDPLPSETEPPPATNRT